MSNHSDDPLRYAPKWARHGGHPERPEGTRRPRDPDPSGRRISELIENIGRGAPDEDPGFELPRVPLLGDSDLDDSDSGPARRARGLTIGHFVLAISVAAITAFFVVVWTRTNTSTQGTSTAEADDTEPRLQAAVERRTQGAEQPAWSRARLAIVQAPPGRVDEAIPLGMWVVGAGASASLLISGVPAGSTLSAGRPLAAGYWRLPASELGNAAIRPPRGFAGTIELAVELRLADDSVADHQSLRLTWVAPPEPAPAPPRAVAAPAVAAPAVAAPAFAAPVATDNTPPRGRPSSQATNAPIRRLDREEIAILLKRGEQLVAAGDYGSARLVLQRAAEAGDVNAAFALATTYDPIQLSARRAIGVAPDIVLARTWYEKARAYGSADASRRLEQLASRDR